MQVLVTRPQPEAARTAARLTALGHAVMLAPLLTLNALEWMLPAATPEAVAFTSAAAVRLAGAQLAGLRHLPVFAVGEATAAAARDAGFLPSSPPRDVRLNSGEEEARAPDGTSASLFEQVSASGITHVLYLAGRDRTARALPPGVEVREVYAAALAPELPASVLGTLAAGSVDLTLLYSARTAAHFGALIDAAGLDRSRLHVAALSTPVLAAAGPGWASGVASAEPTETALFAASGLQR